MTYDSERVCYPLHHSAHKNKSTNAVYHYTQKHLRIYIWFGLIRFDGKDESYILRWTETTIDQGEGQHGELDCCKRNAWQVIGEERLEDQRELGVWLVNYKLLNLF